MRNDIMELPYDRPMATPKFLVCHLCGRNFGTASLGIHLKACASKNQLQITGQKNSSVHLKNKSVQKSNSTTSNTASGATATTAAGDNGNGNKGVSVGQEKLQSAYQALMRKEITTEEFNAMSYAMFENTAVERGVKVECLNCGRQFARPEGLEKHRTLCEKQGNKGGGIFARKFKHQDSETSGVGTARTVDSGFDASKDSLAGLGTSGFSSLSRRPDSKSSSIRVKRSTTKSASPPSKSTPRTSPMPTLGRNNSINSHVPGLPLTESMAGSVSSSVIRAQSSSSATTTPLSLKNYHFCHECGVNFGGHSDAHTWKFCPSCGVKRLIS